MDTLRVNIDGKEYEVKVEELDSGNLKVYFEGETFEVETKSDIEKQLFQENGEAGSDAKKGTVVAPLPGIIFSIDVRVGDKVKKGKKLISLMAMKMENEITAPVSGKIQKITVKKGDTVNKGDSLLVIS